MCVIVVTIKCGPREVRATIPALLNRRSFDRLSSPELMAITIFIPLTLLLVITCPTHGDDKTWSAQPYEKCDSSGNGRIFCVGSSAGGTTSFAGDSSLAGCFTPSDSPTCDIIVKAHRVMKDNEWHVEWQIWSKVPNEGSKNTDVVISESAIDGQNVKGTIYLQLKPGETAGLANSVSCNGNTLNSEEFAAVFPGDKEDLGSIPFNGVYWYGWHLRSSQKLLMTVIIPVLLNRDLLLTEQLLTEV